MNAKQLSVEAIETGTVIDHIPAGLGLAILNQFKLLHYGSAVTVGFNLPSKTQGNKDIIKIKEVLFDEKSANRLALFAPEATVNLIENFQVVRKLHLKMPDTISEVFRCPNPNCASHGEPVKSRFYVRQHQGQTRPRSRHVRDEAARRDLARWHRVVSNLARAGHAL